MNAGGIPISSQLYQESAFSISRRKIQCLPYVYPGKKKSLQLIKLQGFLIVVSDPAEDRTLDPQIKSLLLYQLSYGVKRTANVKTNGFAGKSVS